MASHSIQASSSKSLELTIPADFAEVRLAAERVKEFLAKEGLGEEEIMSIELALAEGCNNAIRYAGPQGQGIPVKLTVQVSHHEVVLTVLDHTPGFDWPQEAELPADDSETGRGVFLMKHLMDSAQYYRGPHQNVLILRRNRLESADPNHEVHSATREELQQQIVESDSIINDMAEELSFCYESLAAIFRHSAEREKNLDIRDFARRLLNDLLQVISADWYVLRLLDKDGAELQVFVVSESHLATGPLSMTGDNAAKESLEMEAALTRQDTWFDPQRTFPAADPLGKLKPGASGVIHPFFFGDRLMGTLTVGRSLSRTTFTAGQINVMGTFADFLAIQIVNAEIQEEQISNRILSREIEIAREIQESLLLKKLPELPGWNLSGHCQSARQVGGDFFDVIPVHDKACLLIIADVMGKGIPAAMFAAILRSLFRALPDLVSQPARLMGQVNRLLYQELSAVDMFITAQLVFIDVDQGVIKAASGGHCPMLLARENGTAQPVSPDGMPLGILPDEVYAEFNGRLDEYSRVLIYTDGLVEGRNRKEEQYGQERLAEWLQNTLKGSTDTEALRQNITRELQEFTGNAALQDDQTFLILARKL